MTSLRVGTCTVCQEVTDVRYIDLYTVGSEGTNLCHACEMVVVGLVQGEIRRYAEIRRRAHELARRWEQRRIENGNESNL